MPHPLNWCSCVLEVREEPEEEPEGEPEEEPHDDPEEEPHDDPEKEPHDDPEEEPHYDTAEEPHDDPEIIESVEHPNEEWLEDSCDPWDVDPPSYPSAEDALVLELDPECSVHGECSHCERRNAQCHCDFFYDQHFCRRVIIIGLHLVVMPSRSCCLTLLDCDCNHIVEIMERLYEF